MLKCSVDLRTVAGPWQWSGAETGWARGEDRILPLSHPALEARSVTDDARTLMVVRERAAGRASLLRSIGPTLVDEAAYECAVQECRTWPVQSIWIEAGPQGVRLQTGLGGVCPLYLAYTKGTLTGSWELMDLRACLSAGALNEREVMRLLVGRPRYGHGTLFSTVKRLSEHSTAYADAQGLRLTYPAAAAHALPSELAENADGAALVDAFESVVDHVLARRPLAPGRTAAQLSGGMDSTNLAISLALNHPQLITPCAMLIGGDAGGQQVARRRTVIGHFGFAADVTVPASAHPPLLPAGLRRSHPEAISPLDEPHLEAADALARALRARGTTTVVSGFGGDEVACTRPPPKAAPGRHRRPRNGAASASATCSARSIPASRRPPWHRRPRWSPWRSPLHCSPAAACGPSPHSPTPTWSASASACRRCGRRTSSSCTSAWPREACPSWW